MKRLLTIVILIFTLQTSSQADDISDFQIEGISIGDGLFDHFTESEFDHAKKVAKIFYYKNNKFAELLFYKLPKFELYDGVKVGWKLDDNKYKLTSLTGLIYFKGNYNDCKKKQKLIIKDIEEFLPRANKMDDPKTYYPNDKTGKSYAEGIIFEIKPLEIIRVYCSNWSDELEKTGLWDALNVVINSSEFQKFFEDNY